MQSLIRLSIVCTTAIFAFTPRIVAGQNRAILPEASTHQGIVLVELFTSEGCSSCPPADALLRQVDGTQSSSGQLIVGISEHVTYWNSLGWSDPFSSQIYTDRQNGYGRRFKLDSVYTPQMVVNGSDQFVGSDKSELMHAIERQHALSSDSVSLHILSTHTSGGMLTVTFSAEGNLVQHDVDIVAVLADNTDKSSVIRGENSGRTLTHVAVARSLARIATVHAPGEQTIQVPLPSSFQATQGHHIILFAQADGFGRVLGADTKPL